MREFQRPRSVPHLRHRRHHPRNFGIIYGGDGNDTLYDADGDVIYPGGGPFSGTIDGGAGYERAWYAHTDLVTSIENLLAQTRRSPAEDR